MLITVTPATAEPVSLDDAKAHLRLGHDSDDALIESLISAAREHLEQRTGRALAVASYRYVVDGCALLPLALPLWPVSSIGATTYTDSNGDVQAVDGAALDADLGQLHADAPGPYSRLSVAFTTAASALPPSLRAAMLLLIGDMYENAEANVVGSIVAENPTLAALIYPHRMNLGV